MLEIKRIDQTFQGPRGLVPVLRGVSLSVKAGDFIAVEGASGAGKTTLLLAAGGLQAPDHGVVLLEEEDFYSLPSETRAARRARKIGFVFQRFHLVPYLSVFDNVMAPSLAISGENGEPTRERALALLERFQLTDRLDHTPAALSVGERQRAALARALINQPSLLLADEPTGNLDRANKEIVLMALREFAEAGGATLLVTHDATAATWAHKRLVLREGVLSECENQPGELIVEERRN